MCALNYVSFLNGVDFYCLNINLGCYAMPLWPNGEGIGLLSQGLWVQIPPGVETLFKPGTCRPQAGARLVS